MALYINREQILTPIYSLATTRLCSARGCHKRSHRWNTDGKLGSAGHRLSFLIYRASLFICMDKRHTNNGSTAIFSAHIFQMAFGLAPGGMDIAARNGRERTAPRRRVKSADRGAAAVAAVEN